MSYVGHHGDPYVFPAGFAEQEHVNHPKPERVGRQGTRRLEHPIPERPEAHQEPRPVRGQEARLRRVPPPRAVRNGPGPVARAGQALFRAISAVWLGVAHAVGAGARGIGRSARDLDPDHRRDGAGLFLFGLAVVVAAAVWFEMPGGVMELVRNIVTGSVGKIGWFVPLVIVLSGWRVMRDPVRNGPAGRQVIGWTALAFGVLGIVHIANGSPEPVAG